MFRTCEQVRNNTYSVTDRATRPSPLILALSPLQSIKSAGEMWYAGLLRACCNYCVAGHHYHHHQVKSGRLQEEQPSSHRKPFNFRPSHTTPAIALHALLQDYCLSSALPTFHSPLYASSTRLLRTLLLIWHPAANPTRFSHSWHSLAGCGLNRDVSPT